MKKLFVIVLVLSAGLSFAFQMNDKKEDNTPSVGATVTDSTDLDDQMRDLEVKMHALEEKMKPHEAEMKEWEAKMKPFETEMKGWEAKMKPLQEKMKALEIKMKKAKSDDERETIGNDMSKVGEEMGKIGEEMGKVGERMGGIGDNMGGVGDKMSKIGEEMGKIGEEMGKIGEKMGARNAKIFSWVFNEMKKEGLITDNKCSIFMENNVLVVNGKTLDATQFKKYKKGIESLLGKPLKDDYSIYFKGTIENLSSDNFKFNGNMSCRF